MQAAENRWFYFVWSPQRHMFEKAKQNRVFQDVVDQIQEAILAGHIQPGEKLPSERELKETFNISRGTLREALRVLEQKGLIEIRLGVHGGAIVRQPSTEPMLETLSLMVRRKEIPFENLQEFRSSVEADIASLAAQRRTDEDLERLAEILEEVRHHLDEAYDWDAFIAADGRFHQELARIARNQLFSLVQKAVHENIHEYYESYLARKREILEENFQDLTEMYNAVKDGNGVRAAALMSSHVVKFDRHMAGQT